MSAPKAVYSVLAGSTNVGAHASNRVQPGYLGNKATLPAVTFQQISRATNVSSGSANGPIAARVQVSSWAETYTAAHALSNAVRGALDRYSGTANGVVVQHVFIETEIDAHEDEASTADRPVWRRIQDFIVHYEE